MTEVGKRKFIIDCDTGVDDAVAIFMALDSPDVDLLAITVVDGNCSLEKAVGNTLKVLKLAQKTVSRYEGSKSVALHVPLRNTSRTRHSYMLLSNLAH